MILPHTFVSLRVFSQDMSKLLDDKKAHYIHILYFFLKPHIIDGNIVIKW